MHPPTVFAPALPRESNFTYVSEIFHYSTTAFSNQINEFEPENKKYTIPKLVAAAFFLLSPGAPAAFYRLINLIRTGQQTNDGNLWVCPRCAFRTRYPLFHSTQFAQMPFQIVEQMHSTQSVLCPTPILMFTRYPAISARTMNRAKEKIRQWWGLAPPLALQREQLSYFVRTIGSESLIEHILNIANSYQISRSPETVLNAFLILQTTKSLRHVSLLAAAKKLRLETNEPLDLIDSNFKTLFLPLLAET